MSAIEIPNLFMAAALVNPDEAGIVPLIGTVFLSQRGFQPYDPAGGPTDPRGGFTKAATGVYWMRTIQGADALNVIVHVDPKGPWVMWGDYFPQVPDLLGPLGDGFTLLLASEDFADNPADPVGFSIDILRYNEEENILNLIGGLIP